MQDCFYENNTLILLESLKPHFDGRMVTACATGAEVWSLIKRPSFCSTKKS